MHEKIDFNFEPVQRGLAPLPQVRYYRHRCRCILGVNPYRSAFQVYCDKNSETIESIDNEAMRQGRDLEDYVAQRFTEATGLKVRRANAIYQSEEHPLLLTDFDRLIVGQKAGLECKTVSPFSADKWLMENPCTLHGSGQSLSGCQRF